MEQKKDRRLSLSGVAGVILCLVFIPVIIVNLILIAGSYLRPQELPGVLGIKPVIVLSGSMEPVIQTGDLILLRSADPAGLKEGDIICYLSSGKAVTHRIVEVGAGEDGEVRFVTQGDANNAADRLAVAPGQVQGIWNGVRIGGLGDFILFMQSTAGLILFILCPLLFFLLWDVWRRRRLDRAESARTAQLEAELAALRREREPAALRREREPAEAEN